MSWEGAGSGAVSGGLAGASFGPWGAAIGAGVGGIMGAFQSDDTPKYEDPNAISRRILADNLMSAKTGQEYAAHQSAGNEAAGRRLFDEVSRDYSGNPAITSGIYNDIGRKVENANTTAGIEGARINQDNQKEAANILNQNSQLGFKEWTANTDRAAMPSAFETMATQGLSQLVGKGASSLSPTPAPATPPTTPGATPGVSLDLPELSGFKDKTPNFLDSIERSLEG
jgi:hypothetical protein